jgi:hypothetical protein
MKSEMRGGGGEEGFSKGFRAFQFWLKSDKGDVHFTVRTISISALISRISR